MPDVDLSGLRFLIADETPYMRKVLRQLLKAFDITEIVEAQDGDEAAQTLLTTQIDFAIVDSGMAPVDGLSFTRHVRTGKGIPNAELPIIILIAHPSVETIAAARDAGATELLSKPVSAQQLFSRIQYSIENSRDFVKAADFIGPDRRRRAGAPPSKEGDRRENSPDA